MPTCNPRTLSCDDRARMDTDCKATQRVRCNCMDKFWNKVDRRGPDDCWPWLKGKDRKGYGQTTIAYQHHRAHRLAWELANGPIPAGLCVLHRCDNPPCCNPGHLWLGTQRDNAHDAIAKGRFKKMNPKPWTHCKNGHEFTPENTIRNTHGTKRCRTCHLAYYRRRRQS